MTREWLHDLITRVREHRSRRRDQLNRAADTYLEFWRSHF